MSCEVCNKTFVNQKCYDNHIENNNQDFRPSCKDRKYCEECGIYYRNRNNKKNPHICGQFKCKDCNKLYSEQPHYCMLKPLDIDKLIKEDEANKIIVTYDIESSIEIDETGQELHKPCLLVSGMYNLFK